MAQNANLSVLYKGIGGSARWSYHAGTTLLCVLMMIQALEVVATTKVLHALVVGASSPYVWTPPY